MQQIIFSKKTKYGTFTDALYVPDSMGSEEIEIMKQARITAFINIVEASSLLSEPEQEND
jgi:hypothetical protein